MSCHMSFQISLLRKLFVTVCTLERFHPVVTECVSLQAVHSEESLGAQRADIWTFTGMRADVDDQVTLTGESFPTVGAGVRRLTRVRASVQQQLARRQK